MKNNLNRYLLTPHTGAGPNNNSPLINDLSSIANSWLVLVDAKGRFFSNSQQERKAGKHIRLLN